MRKSYTIKKCTLQKIFVVLLFLLVGCRTASKIAAPKAIAEKNKDVLILSSLIQDNLRRTHGRSLNLNELIQNDTLKRIANNFSKVDLRLRGGYISVYYKLSESRNNNIELTSKESEKLNWPKWVIKDMPEQYDGELRFDFGERGYKVNKIIVKE